METTIRATFDWDGAATWGERVRRHRILEDVVRDGLDVEDVVVQDEFTHDILVNVAPVWLVYDCT
jgi:hypothetical protein